MVKLLCSNIILGSDRPIRLHGGLVLGVAFDKKIRSGESSQDGSGSRQRLSKAPCAQPGAFACLGPGIGGELTASVTLAACQAALRRD